MQTDVCVSLPVLLAGGTLLAQCPCRQRRDVPRLESMHAVDDGVRRRWNPLRGPT